MSEGVRVRLLKLLEKSMAGFVSGSSLANELAVSRAAVWKAVESLRSEGYEITAVTNKGYRLTSGEDIFSQTGIARHIKTDGVFNVQMRKSVTSTNTVLRDMAGNDAPEGTVIVAHTQTAGKGRQGRYFYSPADNGVYFSLLLRPGAGKASEAALITSAAAVSVARAIEEVFGTYVEIKWVNDLLLNGKKVCGILTEAVFGMESGVIESAVLGIGINVTRPENEFPGTLNEVAAPIVENTGKMDSERCRLVAATLDFFWEYYSDLARRGFLQEYRKRSIVLDRDVFVMAGEEETPALVLGIDDNCGLLVRYATTGETVTLNSGEVRIRPAGI